MKQAAVFVLAFVGLDLALGAGLARLFERSRHGEVGGGQINGAIAQEADFLVLGSSRAKHHVDPDLLSGTLRGRGFNAGINGHDLLYALALMDLRRAAGQPSPRVVLLHVDDHSFSPRDEELARFSIFLPFYDRSELVREVIHARGWAERLKLLSSTYRFNGRALPLLKELWFEEPPPANGFVGEEGVMDEAVHDSAEVSTHLEAPVSPLKVRLFREFASALARDGTRLVVFTSPRRDEALDYHREWVARTRSIVAANSSAVFLDHLELPDPAAFDSIRLFLDPRHLNAAGAATFSRQLAEGLQTPFPWSGGDQMRASQR